MDPGGLLGDNPEHSTSRGPQDSIPKPCRPYSLGVRARALGADPTVTPVEPPVPDDLLGHARGGASAAPATAWIDPTHAGYP
nr:hypothetical protein KPHV_64850 [Kitasatospora purpeofusca]